MIGPNIFLATTNNFCKMNVNKERKKPQETLEVYKLYQKMSKSHPGKEKEIFAHLKEMYAVRT